ncbi:MAG: T9SS C-terminal target domain-containing protein [Ignavibacteriae bacterium]|nr:MAG: T9SS C-terminal target domain-containing protein [Ignavibacteriota bacterium]
MRLTIDNAGYNVSVIQFVKQLDTQYPTVTLTAPADSSEYKIGEQITLSAQAADADGTIRRVEFFHDGVSIGSDSISPYEIFWASDGPGKCSLTAAATDNLGASTTSISKSIFVFSSGLHDSPNYSIEHGFFNAPFDLIVSWDSAGSIIRYTLDGSDPRNNPAAFEASSPATIRIDPASTQGRAATPAVAVRAFAKAHGVVMTDAGSQTYIFTNQVKNQTYPGGAWPQGVVNTKILDYDMDPDVVNDLRYKNLIDDALLEIPTVCLNTDLKNLFDPLTGIYVNPTERGEAWERPASIELIDPHKNEKGFQINAGIRLRGGYSRIPTFYSGQLKHAFRLFFRKDYGKGKLDYPLFGDEGVNSFDCVDLRTAQNYSWSYTGSHICIFTRELFSRDCQRDMGQPYTRSRQYHLYINGVYWGLYMTQERPEASFAESYFGGDKDNYDVIKKDPESYGMMATDGTLDVYSQFCTLSNAGYATNSAYFKVQGRNPDGSVNASYPVYANPDNLIDYMLVIFYAGNFDSPLTAFNGEQPNNIYAVYDRMSRNGFLFFCHDAEHSLMDPQYSDLGVSQYGLDRTGPFYGAPWTKQVSMFNPQYIHERLSKNIEYRVLFSDHIYRHFFNKGALTPQASQQRLAARSSEIDTAVIAESARWGDAKVNPARTKDNDWIPAVNWIKNSFFPTRTAVVLQQLKADSLYPSIDPPLIKFASQEIQVNKLDLQSGSIIRLVNANTSRTGSILYTLDGSDPRAIGGASSASATDAGDSIDLAIPFNVVLKARVNNGTVWSALQESILNTGQDLNGLKMTEIHYNPLADGDISGTEFEFIEMKNVGSSSLSLAGVRFVQGIDYSFPNNAQISPNGFIVLASNAGMFQKRYGFMPTGEYFQQLDNAGERLTLVNISGDTLLNVRYNDKAPWPEAADGTGYSLVAKNSNGYGIPDSADYWRASLSIHGSPGKDDVGTGIDETPAEIPGQYRLDQNYPNPFNPSTTISYQLRAKSSVQITVCDILGRVVAVLVNQDQTAGEHEVVWDAAKYSSGVYFYRLQARPQSEGKNGAAFSETKKLMLLK